MLLVAVLLSSPNTQAGKNKQADKPKQPVEEMNVYRLEFDNDTFVGSDDGFSAGWSFQRHSRTYDTWDDGKRNRLSRWIAKAVPGLGDDGEGGRRVRLSMGLSQIIQTPEAIENPDFQPADISWAGALGFHWTWQSVSQKRLNAFQIYLGCGGECSGAEQVQTFIHDDLGGGTPPEGWDNQLDTQGHINLNYTARRKLAASKNVGVRGWSADFAVGGQFAAGTLFTLAELQPELRFGFRLPEGFTHLPDAAGRGVVMEPTPQAAPGGWAFYFSLVPRVTYFVDIWFFEPGDTVNGNRHPGVDYDDAAFQTLLGIHIARKRFALRLTYYYFPSEVSEPAVPQAGNPTEATQAWANISLEYRW